MICLPRNSPGLLSPGGHEALEKQGGVLAGERGRWTPKRWCLVKVPTQHLSLGIRLQNRNQAGLSKPRALRLPILRFSGPNPPLCSDYTLTLKPTWPPPAQVPTSVSRLQKPTRHRMWDRGVPCPTFHAHSPGQGRNLSLKERCHMTFRIIQILTTWINSFSYILIITSLAEAKVQYFSFISRAKMLLVAPGETGRMTGKRRSRQARGEGAGSFQPPHPQHRPSGRPAGTQGRPWAEGWRSPTPNNSQPHP